MRGKKLGLFGNAKYSRPVFKNSSDAVTKGVDKDIAILVRHEPENVVKKWANAPHDSNIDSTANSSSTLNQPSKKRQNYHANGTMLRAQNTIAKVSRLRRKTESNLFSSNVLPPNNIDEVLKNLSSGNSNAKKQNDENCQFPSAPPLESIIKNILAACPKITLSDSDSMEYTEQVFSLAQNALLQQINKTISSTNKNNESDISKDTSTNNIFKSMCDKTAVFEDDSDGFDECDALNTESPTRIFNMSLQLNKTNSKSEKTPPFDLSAFNTQDSNPESNDSFDNFQLKASYLDQNSSLSINKTMALFKHPTFDKTFQFGASIASDEEFYLNSQEGYLSNNAENSRIKFDKREETFSNNQLFNFSNNL